MGIELYPGFHYVVLTLNDEIREPDPLEGTKNLEKTRVYQSG